MAVMLTLLAGCGKGSTSGGASGGDSAPTSTTGTVIVRFPDAQRDDQQRDRAPFDVATFTGYGASGQVLYGPVSQQVTTTVTLSDVPLLVERLEIVVRTEGRIVKAVVATVRFAGDVSVIVDPLTSGQQLTAIAVAPSRATAAAGSNTPFEAEGTFSDGTNSTTLDVTLLTSWSSSNTAVATVASDGRARAVARGNATITASLTGQTGSGSLTVTSADLQKLVVTPTNPTVNVGRTKQMTATGIYDDGSSQDLTDAVTWVSSDPDVATVSATGLVKALTAGDTSVISASLGGKQGSTVVTVGAARLVSISVAAVPPLPVARTAQFTAIGTFSDGSTEDLTAIASWSSSATSVASISSPGGLATGVAVGSTTIVAKDGTVSSPGTLLTVTDAKLLSIEVTPSSATISVGGTQQFTAVGTFSDHIKRPLDGSVTWSSSNTAAAKISTKSGQATGVAVGSAGITAQDGSVTSATATLTVSTATLQSISVIPLKATTLLDEPVQFQAFAFYSDNHEEDVTSTASWSSSDPSVATVVTGDATPVAAGTTRIKAAVGAVIGFSPLTVSGSTVKSLTISPTQSNDPGNPTSNPSLAVGDTGQFVAIATLQDGTLVDVTRSTQWTSSDPAVSIQTVGGDDPGLATAVSDQHDVKVEAHYKGASAQALVDVGGALLMSLAVYSTDNQITTGSTLQYKAIGYYDDNTTQDLTSQVTWASTNTAAATVNAATGLVTGASASNTFTVIYATHGTGADAVTGALNLQVNPAAQNQTTIPVQIVNSTGYPDEAVYVTTYSPVGNGYYNAFTSTPLVAGIPSFFSAGPTSCGPQYSYPLACLKNVGAHTWQFDCPTQTWGTSSWNFSAGGPVITGTINNGNSPPNNYQAAAFSQTPTVLFNLFEPNFQGTTLFCDISNVDQFSLPMQLQVSGSTTIAVGNHAIARDAVVSGLAISPDFAALAQRHNFTTVDAIAGGKAGGLVDTTKLYTSLDAAIDRGWNLYKGSNNANVDWQNTTFVFKPAAGSADDINVTVKNDGSDYVVHFQKPTTADVLSGHPPFTGTSSAGSQRLQAVIAACLQRGVFDTYADWGDPSDNFGYPDKYYVTTPFNVYAELQHHSSIDQKSYAFSSDDEYKQDPSTGNFNIAGAKLKVILHPVNRAR